MHKRGMPLPQKKLSKKQLTQALLIRIKYLQEMVH